jgi:hypothetical protein
LGIDLVMDEVLAHPYHEGPDVNLFEKGWERRRSTEA